jgi:predicted HAD superfamily Cof-like phosphohydrolase
MVKEFHYMFGHPISKIEKLDINEGSLLDFRHKLIKEEYNEFMDAFKDKDFGEMADALCDLSYVVNGAGLCFGINLDSERKNRNIMKKPDDFTGIVNFKIFSDKKNELDEYVEKLSDSVLSYESIESFEELKNILSNILEYTYDLGYFIGFDMEKMFSEVHASNMTKLCDNENDAIESVKKYMNDERYEEPSYKQKDKYFVVYDKKTSKILKNYKWRIPNLKQFMIFQI